MPLPKRYAVKVPEISKIWDSEGYFVSQMKIWMAQCEALNELYGKPDKKELSAINKALSLNKEEIEGLTQAQGHETNTLLRLVQSKLPPKVGNYIHKGNTSSDVLDTSLSMQSIQSLEILKKGFERLKDSLGKLALKHRKTLQIGRTHTQQAIPQTFGRQIVGWYAEVQRGIERIERAKEAISFGKLSGEIGTSVFIEPALEERTLKKLGLNADPAPTQVISRDRHAEMLALLAINSATLARIATNIRLLSMTEVGEVREPFGDQEGSSSMPHKRNPELSERVMGLSREIRGSAAEELEAVILWLERDISHSSTERFTIPEVFCGLAYAAKLTLQIIDGLEVNPERMLENLNATHGAIYSSRLMNELIDTGKMSSTPAFELAKSLAIKAMDTKTKLYNLASDNSQITDLIEAEALKGIFDPQFYTRNIDVAFKRTRLINNVPKGRVSKS